METHSFKQRFCRQFNCPADQYESRAFRELLYRHAKLVAVPVHLVSPGFFEQDLNFIRYLGEATDLREAKASAAEFQDANVGKRNFWRTTMRIRVSGLKATRLAHQLFLS
jgi:hypothetical protein